jgi:hypothetical protein
MHSDFDSVVVVDDDSFLGLLGLMFILLIVLAPSSIECDWISLITTPHRGPIPTQILELFRNEKNSHSTDSTQVINTSESSWERKAKGIKPSQRNKMAREM